MGPPSPERWREVSRHLDHALDMPEEERRAWLARLRAEDPNLAAEVEALLAERSLASREGFLDAPAEAPPLLAALTGQTFGAYTLTSLIGRGGMGTVWLARRSDGRFEGRAAVKLLNASLLGRSGEERFRREGNILARLADPRIARLLDAGVAPSGQPYLVLEYVEGQPIDGACDARSLDIESRLRLFLEALEAVGHAHANLIVHRDIKPSNVLVDVHGRVKLLDFGIAKLLEGEGEAGVATELTREGGRALTPEFAAPEQVTGAPITTATDVYALGTLLYLLLSGRHPTGATGSSPAELVKAIVETDPERLSGATAKTRAGGSEQLREAAAARSTTPEGLRRSLAGDLETIVAKALKKEPSERYASVTELAEDLRRFLRHEPIRARPDTLRYRAAKFVRRNRVAVGAASLVAAAVVIGGMGILWQAREAARQRDLARAQLDRASAANEFLGFLITDATPSGTKVSASDLFAQGERLVDKQFADDPALRAEMLTMIGDRYMATESWTKAADAFARSARIAPDPGLRAQDLCSLALANVANFKAEGARSMLNEALAALPDAPEYALRRAACFLRSSQFGYYDFQAEPMIAGAREALRVLEASPARSAVERLDARAALAFGYYLKHDLENADRAYAEVMATLEKAGRENTLAAADALDNWGLVHLDGEVLRAEPLFRRALELHQFIEGPDGIAPTILYNVGVVLQELGRYDEAEPYFEDTIQNARARGDRRIERAASLDLSTLYTQRGDLDRAAELLDALGPLESATLPYARGLGSLARGNARLAREQLADSVDRFIRHKSESNTQIFARIELSHAEAALGQSAEALTAAKGALSLAESFAPNGRPSFLVGHARLALGEAELAAGDEAAARGDLRSAADMLARTVGPQHPAAQRARRLAQEHGS